MTDIMLNERDIGFTTSIAGEPYYGYTLLISNRKTQKECKQLKQQILENQRIVERLKHRLRKEENFREFDGVYEALKSILESQA